MRITKVTPKPPALAGLTRIDLLTLNGRVRTTLVDQTTTTTVSQQHHMDIIRRLRGAGTTVRGQFA